MAMATNAGLNHNEAISLYSCRHKDPSLFPQAAVCEICPSCIRYVFILSYSTRETCSLWSNYYPTFPIFIKKKLFLCGSFCVSHICCIVSLCVDSCWRRYNSLSVCVWTVVGGDTTHCQSVCGQLLEEIQLKWFGGAGCLVGVCIGEKDWPLLLIQCSVCMFVGGCLMLRGVTPEGLH